MKKRVSRAIVHGAVSVVNAIATGKGSAVGISLQTVAEVELATGSGVRFVSGKTDDVLISAVVRRILPAKVLTDHQVLVRAKSDIPIGFGLKSSSAVSTAVALACSRLVSEDIDDQRILEAGVGASLEARVSITGAYDDASACYHGGFVVCDNVQRKLLERRNVPQDLHAVLFLPRRERRGDPQRLKLLSELFEIAFRIASDGDYWKAMKLNGTLVSAAIATKYEPTFTAMQAGAIAASISGNGPSTAAIVSESDLERVKNSLSGHDGRVISSRLNNEKASAELIDDG